MLAQIPTVEPCSLTLHSSLQPNPNPQPANPRTQPQVRAEQLHPPAEKRHRHPLAHETRWKLDGKLVAGGPPGWLYVLMELGEGFFCADQPFIPSTMCNVVLLGLESRGNDTLLHSFASHAPAVHAAVRALHANHSLTHTILNFSSVPLDSVTVDYIYGYNSTAGQVRSYTSMGHMQRMHCMFTACTWRAPRPLSIEVPEGTHVSKSSQVESSQEGASPAMEADRTGLDLNPLRRAHPNLNHGLTPHPGGLLRGWRREDTRLGRRRPSRPAGDDCTGVCCTPRALLRCEWNH